MKGKLVSIAELAQEKSRAQQSVYGAMKRAGVHIFRKHPTRITAEGAAKVRAILDGMKRVNRRKAGERRSQVDLTRVPTAEMVRELRRRKAEAARVLADLDGIEVK